VVVLSPSAVTGEVPGIEEPENMHGKWMLWGELMHHHLQDQLWETPLNSDDFLFQLLQLRWIERARGICDRWSKAR
jgi:hypothetical protein